MLGRHRNMDVVAGSADAPTEFDEEPPIVAAMHEATSLINQGVIRPDQIDTLAKLGAHTQLRYLPPQHRRP